MLSILTHFRSNRSQHVVVDGCRSKLVNVVLCEEYQRAVFGPLLLLLYTLEFLSIQENKVICYADDSTLRAILQSPGVRVTIAESLIRDLGRVSEWSDLRGTKLNASKAKKMIVSRSRTMQPRSPSLTIEGTVLKEYDNLDM